MNYNFGHFPYFYNIGKEVKAGIQSKTSLAGLTLIDPVAWYYWITGKEKYWEHLQQYMKTGINGGETPAGRHGQWIGYYEARFFPYASANRKRREDFTPPAAVADLRVEVRGDDLVVRWTAPSDPDTAYYHLVWERFPIAPETNRDPAVWNWWKARVVEGMPKPEPGRPQSVTLKRLNPDRAAHFGLFSFDATGNMSAMSNGASLDP